MMLLNVKIKWIKSYVVISSRVINHICTTALYIYTSSLLPCCPYLVFHLNQSNHFEHFWRHQLCCTRWVSMYWRHEILSGSLIKLFASFPPYFLTLKKGCKINPRMHLSPCYKLNLEDEWKSLSILNGQWTISQECSHPSLYVLLSVVRIIKVWPNQFFKTILGASSTYSEVQDDSGIK